MKRSESISKLTKALNQFQAEVQNPKFNRKNEHLKNRYADLSEILTTVRPVLTKYGLSITQEVFTVERQPEHVAIKTTIFHESGEYMEFNPLSLPAYQKLKDGRKEFNAQGAGSSITYAKRYQLQSVLGIAADDDVDGEVQYDQTAYTPKTTITTPTEATLKAKYQLVMGSIEGFDEYVKGIREKGHDDTYIVSALDKALEKRKQGN